MNKIVNYGNPLKELSHGKKKTDGMKHKIAMKQETIVKVEKLNS